MLPSGPWGLPSVFQQTFEAVEIVDDPEVAAALSDAASPRFQPVAEFLRIEIVLAQ
jgi:hypothetical protein